MTQEFKQREIYETGLNSLRPMKEVFKEPKIYDTVI